MPASRTTSSRDASHPPEDPRRARKRATDRRAQREHRQRRKAYVQHLEASLHSLTQQACAEDRVSSLLQEVRRLGEERDHLRRRLHQVHTLTAEVAPPSATAAPADTTPKPASSVDTHVDAAVPATDVAAAVHDAGGDWLGEGTSTWVPSTPSASTAAPPALAPAIDFADADAILADPFEFDPLLTDTEDASGSAIAPGRNSLDAAVDFIAPGMPTCSLEASDPAPRAMIALSTRSLCSDLSPPSLHLCFPRYSGAIGPADQAVENFLKEARQEHLLANFDDSEPSLPRLLSDPPQTTLAFRLFHFISNAGPMKLHLFLGIFWVQYLVLRWMVLGTRAAYLRIPHFMRPTHLECLIPHRPFVSMIVWPDLRHALIRDGDLGDPEGVGVQMLEHLNSKWDANQMMTTGNVASMNVANIIEKQAEQPQFWTVDGAFYNKFPQYAGCGPPLM